MFCRCFVLLLLWAPLTLWSQTQGIFADFTTSMGSFSCSLDYTNAPRAVASFIGLATGKRAWINTTTLVPSTNAFYDGLKFHRVIAGFMIQGGCPKGTGTGDPGYSFIDEFTSSRRFDRAGVLAMANSKPDDNGSQFFVTVAATPWLNDNHTIFGQVISGMDVVNNISQVATDANAVPTTPVIMNSVRIRYQGAAALAFDINAQGLPSLAYVPMAISNASPHVWLSFTNRHNADNILLVSSNLTGWRGEPRGMAVDYPPAQWTQVIQREITNRTEFFRLAQMYYPAARPTPASLVGKTITFEFDQAFGTNFTYFDAGGQVLFQWPKYGGSTVFFGEYWWETDPYCGRLLPMWWHGLDPFFLHLKFSTPTNGTFVGKYYTNNPTYTGVFRVL